MSQQNLTVHNEDRMKILGRQIRWQMYAVYAVLATVSFIAFAPIFLHLDHASDPYTNERATFAWMVTQRNCSVVDGKDAAWYGKWATWKCQDGTEHVSKFGAAEIQQFMESQRTFKVESVYGSDDEDKSVLSNLMEFVRSTFRVNLNTFLLLCILVQVTLIHYKLRG